VQSPNTGLKFFDVFGPNGYHKGAMASVLVRVFDGAKRGEPVRLLKSYRADVVDGEQKRDFIYVDDAVAVVRWPINAPSAHGICNFGTGQASSFRAMARVCQSACLTQHQVQNYRTQQRHGSPSP
jgi:ADP-L-glycero-D-manno-heptose 6-epimerase